MALKNVALNSWLRQVGNTRRKMIYKKLWRHLKSRGLTDQEVNRGLRQLIVKIPCVRLTRCGSPRLPRSVNTKPFHETLEKKYQYKRKFKKCNDDLLSIV